MPKYANLVASGRMTADQAAQTALSNWERRVEQIHMAASSACQNLMGRARLLCVLREMINRAAQLRQVAVAAR